MQEHTGRISLNAPVGGDEVKIRAFEGSTAQSIRAKEIQRNVAGEVRPATLAETAPENVELRRGKESIAQSIHTLNVVVARPLGPPKRDRS